MPVVTTRLTNSNCRVAVANVTFAAQPSNQEVSAFRGGVRLSRESE